MTISISSSKDGAGELRDRIRVMLLGRVLVVSVFLAAAGAVYLGLETWPARAFGPATFVVVAGTYAATILSVMLLPHVRRLWGFALAQVVLDLALISGALVLTGGAGSPFVGAYLLAITSAAGLLLLPGALLAAAAAILSYGGLVIARAAIYGTPDGVAQDVVVPIGLGALCLITGAYGVGSLARRLEAAQRELARQRSENGQLADVQRALAAHLDCGVLLIGPDGRARSANAAVQQILGLSAGEVEGRELGWLLPLLGSTDPRGLGGSEHAGAEAVGLGAADSLECAYRAPDDAERQLRVKRIPLADTWSQEIGELVLLQDVTRLRELEGQVGAQPQDAPSSEHVEASGPPLTTSSDEAVVELDAIELPAEPTSSGGGAGGEPSSPLVGSCDAMLDVQHLISKVAVVDATVLVLGESGTGKELVARAIHDRSDRARGPFVVVNCGAIPENLIESELFGHVRGAFTGAVADRPGLFKRAHGGTIFLDEIGELPLHLQVRLLRVLQDHTVMPVGATNTFAIDVRVVAATNRDLETLVKQGQFREDLYYRLAVISVELPPLRERGADLRRLVAHFIRQAGARRERRLRGISERALRRLLSYRYPGNVRELENVIEHSATLADGDVIREADLPESVLQTLEPVATSLSYAVAGELSSRGRPTPDRAAAASSPPASADLVSTPDERRERVAESTPARLLLPADDGSQGNLDDLLARREKEMLLAALARAAGVKKRAASLLGINYRSFRHRLQKYGLDTASDDASGMRPGGTWPAPVSGH